MIILSGRRARTCSAGSSGELTRPVQSSPMVKGVASSGASFYYSPPLTPTYSGFIHKLLRIARSISYAVPILAGMCAVRSSLNLRPFWLKLRLPLLQSSFIAPSLSLVPWTTFCVPRPWRPRVCSLRPTWRSANAGPWLQPAPLAPTSEKEQGAVPVRTGPTLGPCIAQPLGGRLLTTLSSGPHHISLSDRPVATVP